MQYGDSGNSSNPRISDESSTLHQDYEIVAESNVQAGDSEPVPPHQSTSNDETSEDQSAEKIECEGYSSLHRDSSDAFAHPAIYTKLHLYANTSPDYN